MPPGRLLALLGCVLALPAFSPLAAAQRAGGGTTVPAASAAAVAAAARTGGQLTISGLTLDGEAQPSSLDLQPLDVWDSDAQVVVHGAGGEPQQQAPPSTRMYRGSIGGRPQSTVVLMVGDEGISGLANDGNELWKLGAEAPAGPSVAAAAAVGSSLGLTSFKARQPAGPMASAAARPPKRGCGNRHGRGRPNGRSLLHEHDHEHEGHDHGSDGGLPNMADALHAVPAAFRKLAQAASVLDSPKRVTLAIDTDAEFYALFRSPRAAADYVALLVGYADLVFTRELGVDLRLSYLELRPSARAASYPASYRNMPDVDTALPAFQAYWNANRRKVPRTLAAMLSGKPDVEFVGMAWEGVLCDWYDSPSDNWAYSFTSNIQGDFRWNGVQGSNPSAVVWDIFNFAHEIGHNFGAIHTVDFCGAYAMGSPYPVDNCVASENNCPGRPGTLPKCNATVYSFGGGGGTIMSYCDQLEGGRGWINNIALTFGLKHPCGVMPDRVVTLMRRHVAAQAKAYPQCFRGTPPALALGTWELPGDITALPYTSPRIQTFASGAALPVVCNDLATVVGKSSVTKRAIKVFRLYSGNRPAGTLTVSSCGLVTAGRPALSVRSTWNINPLAGPWVCEGSTNKGCGTQAGFKLTVPLRPFTWYYLLISDQGLSPTPKLRFTVTRLASTGKTTPLPAPAGSWTNALTIKALPYLSTTFNGPYYLNTAPADCSDVATRVSADRTTRTTGRVRVYRWLSGATAKGTLIIQSCGHTASGIPYVTVRSTTNPRPGESWSPLSGPWSCWGSATGGCPSGQKGFRKGVPLRPNTWYYILVGYAAGNPPALKLDVRA